MPDSDLCRNSAEDEKLDRLSWWEACLRGAPDLLSLPFDRIRPLELSARRGKFVMPLTDDSPATDIGLDEIGLLAAIAVLLQRYAATDDLVVGVASNESDVLPLRLSMDPDSTFATLRQLVTDALADASGHGVPDVHDINRRLELDGKPNRNSLAQVAMRWTTTARPREGSSLDLIWELETIEGHQQVTWDYSTDLFEQATVEQMAECLDVLVHSALHSPESGLADLDLLGEAERHRLLVEFNDTATTLSKETLVSRLVEQVRLGPHRRAVACGAASLSYGELDERSDELARYLATLGVKPGDRVGVFCDRSVDLLVALVAVMKRGAAYVPVDPGYPVDRVAFMLGDAQVSAVITQAALEPELPAVDAPVVRIDADWPQVASAPDVEVAPDDVAYVIYTSGSTGRPKGVMVEHAGVVNLLDQMAERPGLSPGQVMVGLTTPAFDLSVPDLFLPLVSGATLVLALVAETRDPLALARLFDEAQADLVQATPATWRMLCESGWAGRRAMKVVCGGEGYGADLVKELLERVGEVWNFYGPTEATVWSVCTRLDHDVADPVPMGRPIANTSCYVLDEHRRPVPLGVPGELYLGGVGLARGYLGRPELTEERFVADPFSAAPGARMYRTGDLVRYRGDGTLVFIGRTDHQVKLRGFRIELGEIESALSAQEGIAQAVVIVREDDPGDRRLVAYVVGSGAPVERGTLTEALRRLVPAYMVPSAIVTLERFPLTPNGKLDRRALPEPERGEGYSELVDPRDELEAEVAALCRDVFRSQPFGVTDNFFDLGFDSITAARLFTRIERAFGAQLPLATLFQAPSVAQIAALLRDRTRLEDGSKWSALVPIRTDGSHRPFFGVHGGAGTSLLYYPLAHLLDAEQPFYGIQAVGLYGRETPQTSVAEMAALYISELRSVQPHGPYALGGYCFGGLVAYEMAMQLMDAGEKIDLVAMFNAPSPSYNQRFDPEFDNERVLTVERGEQIERLGAINRSLGRSIARQLEATRSLSLPARLRAISTAAMERIRGLVTRRIRTFRVGLAIRLRRPLPDGLREANVFGHIAMNAQDRYQPPKRDVPIVVYRAEGLYYEPALGWEEYSTHILDCVEVPGFQPGPRRTMREPCVKHVAVHLSSRLALQADGEPQPHDVSREPVARSATTSPEVR